MLDHKNIRLETGVDYFDIAKKINPRYIIYTGAIDEYFNYRFGKLPYRSIHFEHKHFPLTSSYQPVGTVNYPMIMILPAVQSSNT